MSPPWPFQSLRLPKRHLPLLGGSSRPGVQEVSSVPADPGKLCKIAGGSRKKASREWTMLKWFKSMPLQHLQKQPRSSTEHAGSSPIQPGQAGPEPLPSRWPPATPSARLPAPPHVAQLSPHHDPRLAEDPAASVRFLLKVEMLTSQN